MLCWIVQEVQTLDLEERCASVWWKAKKWVMNISYRLFNRYGVPKHCKNAIDTQFAEMFSVSVHHSPVIRVQSVCWVESHLVQCCKIQ